MSKEYYYKKDLLNMGFTKAMIKKLLPPPIEVRSYFVGNPPRKKWEKSLVKEIMKTTEYQEELKKAEIRKKVSQKGTLTRMRNDEDDLKKFLNSIKLKDISFEDLTEKALRDKADYVYNKLINKQAYLERRYGITDNEKEYIMNYERPINPEHDDFYSYAPNYYNGDRYGAYVENHRQEYQDICYEIKEFNFVRPDDDEKLYKWIVYYILNNLVYYDEELFTISHRTNKENWEEEKNKKIFELISETYPCLKKACVDVQKSEEEKSLEKKHYSETNFL